MMFLYCLQNEVEQVLKLQYWIVYVSIANETLCTTHSQCFKFTM